MRNHIQNLRARGSHTALQLLGMVRKVVVSMVGGNRGWQFRGYQTPDGDETFASVDVYQHAGFQSRPSAGASAVLVAGDTGKPASVGEFDPAMAFPLAGNDEVAISNSKAVVYAKADGTIEARSRNGVAVPLATKADLDAHRTWILTHIHPTPSGNSSPPLLVAPGSACPSPAGTTKLKGE